MTARSALLAMKHAIAIGSALALAACANTGARSQAQMSGMQLYEHLCSSCHGVDGRGDGPVASLLTIVVPDLTRIAQREGGEFPTQAVRRSIDGRWDRRAHGARDMSVWGWQFYDSAAVNDAQERARVDAMVSRLVDYVRSIQVQ
jgi:hypothetical protein